MGQELACDKRVYPFTLPDRAGPCNAQEAKTRPGQRGFFRVHTVHTVHSSSPTPWLFRAFHSILNRLNSQKRGLRMKLELDGQVAVIVGGARGLGRSIAEGFLAEHARVVLVDRDSEVEQTARELAGHGGRPAGD